MVRPGSGRFEVGFWVGFRVGLRARDFPTEGVRSRTPLIIRTVEQNWPKILRISQFGPSEFANPGAARILSAPGFPNFDPRF